VRLAAMIATDRRSQSIVLDDGQALRWLVTGD
jgi:hypothetical protein